MPESKQHLEEVLDFIRQHRSNENNFDLLYEKLLTECEAEEKYSTNQRNSYLENLREADKKQASEYRQSKENNDNAWPEFEKFVTQFETSIIKEVNNQ